MVDFLPLLLTGLVLAIPGIVFSFALFSGTAFKKLDKFFAGLILAIILVPFLSHLENVLLGLQFSTGLILFNDLLVLAGAVALLFYRKKLGIFSPANFQAVALKEVEKAKVNPMGLLVPVLLVLTVLVGFYYRYAYSWMTNFFEFDPYYYNFLTELLVKGGSIPLHTDISYFPLGKFYHEPALVSYLTGSWVHLYNLFAGAAYDKGTLILISNLYPPLLGALLSVLAYWLLKTQYDENAGLLGAVLMAATPQLLQKFAAGVSELQPWGIFSALLIFAAFTLAFKYKNKQFIALAALATFTAMIGAAQSLWPLGVMSAFFMVQAFVNYYAGHSEERLALIAVVFSATTLAAAIFSNVYEGLGLFHLSVGEIIAILSAFPALAFYAISKSQRLSKHSRRRILAGVLIAAFIFSLLPVLPGGRSPSGLAGSYIESTAAFASAGKPLAKTIAEETPTGDRDLTGAAGILSPFILIALGFMLALGAIETLLAKKEHKLAAGFVLGCLAIVLLRLQLAEFAIGFGSATGLTIIASLGKLLAANQIFSFLIISIASSIIAFIHLKEEDRSEAPLLFTFIIYPVAYIGLNKVKFLIHLSFALVVGTGVLIGEITSRARFLHEYFKVGESIESPRKWTMGVAVALALLIASIQVAGFADKSPGIVNSVDSLKYGRISQDWLDTMSWLKNNTSYNDPQIVANCHAKFGHDCRVISWWDYGHWTAFLGETKTVLDPGNAFAFYDQEVAYGFVDNQTAFRRSMEFHNASHVLVDFQLIQKWGALNFLSGSCSRYREGTGDSESVTCPLKAQIEDWESGTGRSEYEFEHSFEYITLTQQPCPFGQNLVLGQSNLGLPYCFSNTEMIPLDRNGLRTDLARTFKILNLKEQIDSIDNHTAYLLPTGANQLALANPDFSILGKPNYAVNSVYARLYLFENLPGFKLVYRSPSGEVKIFEKVPA